MKYSMYTSREIKPRGWLLDQLKIQASGLSGNLDKFWPDIKDSKWKGGPNDGWERVPYWLDGFIPLAYLLDDDDLKARAQRYIEAIIAGQKPDGWICPCEDSERKNYDSWAVQLISKVLTVYYDCSGDERIPDILYRAMKNYYDLLSSGEIKLFRWGKSRWFEAFVALNFLKERYDDEWITELGKILHDQGEDYEALIPLWKTPLCKWTFETHIVNLAMMLKSEAVSHRIIGSEYTDLAEKLRTVLDEYNGTPVGLFTGDECLSGLSPIQGTELCAVVEQMYSYELLYAYTGDKKWAERLEVLAFNALPATYTDDMWAHQYVQLSNQPICTAFPGKSLFGTNSVDAHLFGLEPNYGCCTANLSQGYPKLALSTFMKKGNVIENVVAIPSQLNDDGITITLDTEYPFKNEFMYTINSNKKFKFTIRIPSFAQNLAVNGEYTAPGNVDFDIPEGTTQIHIAYETKPYLVKRPYELANVKCGSLVFSLPVSYESHMIEYERYGVERKFPYCDYALTPTSDWNYGLCEIDTATQFQGVTEVPFSSLKPPVVLSAKVRKIDWGYQEFYDNICAKVPQSREPVSDVEDIKLYPYGCTRLRMTEMPIIE